MGWWYCANHEGLRSGTTPRRSRRVPCRPPRAPVRRCRTTACAGAVCRCHCAPGRKSQRLTVHSRSKEGHTRRLIAGNGHDGRAPGRRGGGSEQDCDGRDYAKTMKATATAFCHEQGHRVGCVLHVRPRARQGSRAQRAGHRAGEAGPSGPSAGALDLEALPHPEPAADIQHAASSLPLTRVRHG
jgi:hypothetical protein